MIKKEKAIDLIRRGQARKIQTLFGSSGYYTIIYVKTTQKINSYKE